MALSEAAKKAVYLRHLMIGLSFIGLANTDVYVDNGARKLAENPVFHNRTKHIDVRHHFVREILDAGCLTISHVATEDMAADVLTKALGGPKLKKCLEWLGLCAIKRS